MQLKRKANLYGSVEQAEWAMAHGATLEMFALEEAAILGNIEVYSFIVLR